MRSSSAVALLVQLARRLAVLRVLEDPGERALQLPGAEEERPVDVRHQLGERHVVEHAPAEERRRRRCRRRAQSSAQRLRARLRERQQRLLAACGRAASRSSSCSPRLLASNAGALRRIEQRRHHAHRARGVEHVHGRPCVLGRDLHGRVLRGWSWRRRSAAAGRSPAAPSRWRRAPSRRATA